MSTPPKTTHEIRDPIHSFIRLDSDERSVVDSRPVQRLRHIHQLALTYHLYPSTTHRRFEHSLGVMELASRVFDVVTNPLNLNSDVSSQLRELSDGSKPYWRRVLRMAALCHDIGHLPFSHAAEDALLPLGWTHERLTVRLIESEEMMTLWEQMTPPLRTNDIVKLAVGKAKLEKFGYEGDRDFTDWQAILSEIIVSDAFGVDRMDYLLRDSYHAGVAYGQFDHYRLIDTLRILPPPRYSPDGLQSSEPHLGVEFGGLRSAESLILARYFMFTQVYLHHIRRIYDYHLMQFMQSYFDDGRYPVDLESHISLTDNELLHAIAQSAGDTRSKAHAHAQRITSRNHYRKVWESNPTDMDIEPGIVESLNRELAGRDIFVDVVQAPSSTIDFPVQQPDEQVASAQSLSNVFQHIPPMNTTYVFSAHELVQDVLDVIESCRERTDA